MIERILEFLREIRESRKDFSKKTGIDVSLLSWKNRIPKADKIGAIINAYPNVNALWLITGQGEMLEKGYENKFNNNQNSFNNNVKYNEDKNNDFNVKTLSRLYLEKESLEKDINILKTENAGIKSLLVEKEKQNQKLQEKIEELYEKLIEANQR